ncbi:MAG: hypothetical protein HYV46_22295 [candidate division NC10 bacterium]|nr:hypothetical protein [candidate division NC10 bacterium]
MDQLTLALLPLAAAILLMGLWMVSYERRQRRRTADLAQAMQRQGFQPVPDAVQTLRRVQPLLHPLDYLSENEKGGSAFSWNVGGRDAFFLEWSYDSPGGLHGSSFQVDQRAYVTLGPGAPYLRALPKVIFGKPASPIGIDEDRAFSRTFWVEGTDREAIRRYLGPELREFLVVRGNPWRFHAGPEGVALVCRGRASSAETSRIRATLERLATVTEAAARR